MGLGNVDIGGRRGEGGIEDLKQGVQKFFYSTRDFSWYDYKEGPTLVYHYNSCKALSGSESLH